MAISITIQEYLDSRDVPYEVVEHPHSRCSLESAQTAHIPGDQLAKCVVLEDQEGYLMAILPSTRRVDLDILGRYLGRALELATEAELENLFDDCETGAVPAIGQAFGYDVIVDNTMLDCEDVYIEAGDHTDLIHLSGPQFNHLMEDVEQARFSYHI